MGLRIVDERIDIGLDGVDTALHGRDGVRLPLRADALAHHGPELPESNPRRPSPMHTGQVAAEDKDLIGLQLGDELGGTGKCYCAPFGPYGSPV